MTPPIPEIEPAPRPSGAADAPGLPEARGCRAIPPGVLARMLRRWWLIVLLFAAGLIGGLFYFAAAAKTYAASSVIGTSHIAAGSRMDPYFAAQRAMILSAGLLRSCGADLSQVQVSTSDAEGTITIRTDAATGAQAARLANAIAMAYVQQRDHARSPAAGELKDLSHQREESAGQRDAAAVAQRDFQISQQRYESADRAATTRLAQLRSTLAVAQAALDDLAAESQTASSAIADPSKLAELIASHRSTGIFDSLDVQRDRVNNQIDALTPTLEQQRKSMLPQHPALQASEAKMRQLQAARAALDAQYGPAYQHWLDQQRQSADQKVRMISQMVAQQEAASADATRRSAQVAALAGKVKADDARLAELDRKIRDLTLANLDTSPAARVIVPAEVPRHPIRPDRNEVLMLGGGIGLLAGLLLASLFRVKLSTR